MPLLIKNSHYITVISISEFISNFNLNISHLTHSIEVKKSLLLEKKKTKIQQTKPLSNTILNN